MTLSTGENVREMYRLALQQDIAKQLKAKPDWDRFLVIAKEGEDRLTDETASYRDNYTQRLAEARAQVLRERTGLHYDQPRPVGAPDPINNDEIERVAELRVQHDHVRRRAAIREDEIDGYRDLRADLQSRTQQQGRARDAFAMASPTQTRTLQR